MKIKFLLLAGASIVCAAVAIAAEKGSTKEGSKRSISLPAPSVFLKDGPGMDETRRYCGICHSLDYITTQQKFPKVKWQGVVNKMIKTYGAPIPDKDAKIIVDYISTNYGSGK